MALDIRPNDLTEIAATLVRGYCRCRDSVRRRRQRLRQDVKRRFGPGHEVCFL